MVRQNLLPSDQRNAELLKCRAVAEAINKLVVSQVAIAASPELDQKAKIQQTVASRQQDVAFALDEAIRIYIEGDAP